MNKHEIISGLVFFVCFSKLGGTWGAILNHGSSRAQWKSVWKLVEQEDRILKSRELRGQDQRMLRRFFFDDIVSITRQSYSTMSGLEIRRSTFSELHKNGRPTDFEALKLRNALSGIQ